MLEGQGGRMIVRGMEDGYISGGCGGNLETRSTDRARATAVRISYGQGN